MPTGYTEKLKDKKYNVLKWLTEDIVRAFGVCAVLRDLDSMSKEEIEKFLEESSKEKEESINAEIDWEKEYDKHKKYYKNLIKQAKKNEQEYKKSINIIEQMINKNTSKDELLQGVLKYALEQLELIKDDFNTSFYEKEVSESFEEFKKDRMKTLEYEKEYKERNKKLLERRKQDLEAYKKYTKNVEELYNKINIEEV